MLEFFRSVFSPPRDLILPILAAWLGLLIAERRSERHMVSKETLNELVLHGLIGFVIAGRCIYALGHLPAFASSPLSLFSPNPELFDPTGALLVAILIGFLICRKEQVSILNALDALTPFFAVLAVGIALMHLATGTAFGKPTRVPWAMELWGALRHPSQIYEALSALGILAIILTLSFRFKPGVLWLMFTSLSAGMRLFLEAFRGDSSFLPGGFRQAQAAALLVLAACFVLMEIIQKKPHVLGNGDAEPISKS